MARDEFKTQVLILHSEQAALDSLSSGFGDHYTVHCATSGSEALNTLVETPINVIISAQKLPGMSGLEALREAKKRSPDTVGILLAGTSDNGLESLVGDQEVFQVVRGNVTSDSLLALVDDATRQMRLMALAESANDTAANPDEIGSQHIVMETSENGSAIISDGTGRMPALDPKKVASSASIGSRAVDILVLTKDRDFLETIKNSSRGMHEVYYANTLAQANDAIGKHKIGVAVVDAAMVGDKVEQLTQHLRKISARLVAIVAGRRDDGEMLMDLINRGKVYRFLLKPVSPGRARLAVEASVKHHLEAPDAAFRLKAAPAGTSTTPSTAPKPAEKPVLKPAPVAKAMKQPSPQAKPGPMQQPAQEKARQSPPPIATPVDPPFGVVGTSVDNSPIEDGLADAFGEDDASFTETVTGLISSVVGKFSSDQNDEPSSIDPIISEPAQYEVEPQSLADAGSGGSLLQNPKMLGMGAAAVVIIAGTLIWLFASSGDKAVTEEAELATPSIPEAEIANEDIAIEDIAIEAAPAQQLDASVDTGADALIDEARLARDSRQIFDPPGENAIELYSSALDAEPGNSVAAAELGAVLEQALGMAETAMLESRLDDAAAALERVGEANADHARLPFLNAQLAQIQLRARLDVARLAIRETRFEDAASALAAARDPGIVDAAEIDAVNDELVAARSAQRVDDVLAKANERLESGNYLIPPNDNARYYYDLVLSSDRTNTAAQQGLSIITSKLSLQAIAEIERDNLGDAESILADARDIDPSNAELASAESALSNWRNATAERNRRDDAAKLAETELLAEEKRVADAALAETEAEAEAETEAIAETEGEAETEAIAGAETEAIAEAETEAETETETIAQPMAVPASESAELAVNQAESSATEEVAGVMEAENRDDSADVGGELVAAESEMTSNPPAKEAVSIAPPRVAPVPVSSLNRVKYVAPKYPRGAQRRNVSGWVEVLFVVAMDGSVKNVTIRSSEPGDTFVASAVTAVEKWKFEPVIENGRTIEKVAGVRMMFAME